MYGPTLILDMKSAIADRKLSPEERAEKLRRARLRAARLRLYDAELVDLVEGMCDTVEDRVAAEESQRLERLRQAGQLRLDRLEKYGGDIVDAVESLCSQVELSNSFREQLRREQEGIYGGEVVAVIEGLCDTVQAQAEAALTQAFLANGGEAILTRYRKLPSEKKLSVLNLPLEELESRRLLRAHRLRSHAAPVVELVEGLCDEVEVRDFEERERRRLLRAHRLQCHDEEIVNVVEELCDAVEERHTQGWGDDADARELDVSAGDSFDSVSLAPSQLVDSHDAEGGGADEEGEGEEGKETAGDEGGDGESGQDEDSRTIANVEEEDLSVRLRLQIIEARCLYLEMTESEQRAYEQEQEYESVRLQRIEQYPEEIVDLVTKMTFAVEIAAAYAEQHAFDVENGTATESYTYEDSTLLDDGSSLQMSSQEVITQQPSIYDGEVDLVVPEDTRQYGCEVSLMIFVTDEERKRDGLEDIEAEDIAVMLRQQLMDLNSPLYLGDLTQHILDVKYTVR